MIVSTSFTEPLLSWNVCPSIGQPSIGHIRKRKSFRRKAAIWPIDRPLGDYWPSVFQNEAKPRLDHATAWTEDSFVLHHASGLRRRIGDLSWRWFAFEQPADCFGNARTKWPPWPTDGRRRRPRLQIEDTTHFRTS